MSTSKKIIITLLVLAVLFVLFGVTNSTQAQYGFSKLRGVGGLQQASVGEIIVRVISWVMAIIGLICVIFIIYGGVIYATSGGSEEHITRGKKILLWSVIGLVICILAFTIASAIVGAIGGEGGAGGKCHADYKGPIYEGLNFNDTKERCQSDLNSFASRFSEMSSYCWCGTWGATSHKLYCSKQFGSFNKCQTWCGEINSAVGVSYSCDCGSCQ